MRPEPLQALLDSPAIALQVSPSNAIVRLGAAPQDVAFRSSCHSRIAISSIRADHGLCKICESVEESGVPTRVRRIDWQRRISGLPKLLSGTK